MKYLLDTHAFIWFLEGYVELSEQARNSIKNLDNEVYVSKISLWEIAIKQSLGKLKLAVSLEDMAIKANEMNIEIIDIDLEAIYLLQNLPHHHKDPFDRILICQAKHQNLTLISRDEKFRLYEVEIFW